VHLRTPSFGLGQKQYLLKDKGQTCVFLKDSFEKAKLFKNVSSFGPFIQTLSFKLFADFQLHCVYSLV